MGLGSKGKQRDYTAPVNFVKGGVVGATGTAKKEGDDTEEKMETKSDTDTDSDDEYSGRHIKAGGLGSSSRDNVGRVQSEGQIAGMRSYGFNHHQSLGKGFGEWEKHTRGIGAALLLKMGYQPGKGLGKTGEGRTEIVEAYLRKKGAGIGAAGPEGGRPKKVGKDGKAKRDSDDEEEKEFKDKLNQWRTGDAVGGKAKKVSYVYKTVDEVLQEGQYRKIDRKGDREKVKVIDMTGREQRVMTGYSAIAGQHKPAEEGDPTAPLAGLQEKRKANFELPELVHNLDLLVRFLLLWLCCSVLLYTTISVVQYSTVCHSKLQY